MLNINLNYDLDWPKPRTESEIVQMLRADFHNPEPIIGPESGESEDAFVKRRLADCQARKPLQIFRVELAADRLPDYPLALNLAALLASTTWSNRYEIASASYLINLGNRQGSPGQPFAQSKS